MKREKINLTKNQISEIVSIITYACLDDGANGDLKNFIRNCKLAKTLSKQGGLEYTKFDDMIETEKDNWYHAGDNGCSAEHMRNCERHGY